MRPVALILLAALAWPARAATQAAPDALAASLAQRLEGPLRDTTPEARNADVVAVRVLGTAAPDAREALQRAVVAALGAPTRAVSLPRGDTVDDALTAAREVGAARALLVDTDDARTHAGAAIHVLDPGPWFTFLADALPAPRLAFSTTLSTTTAATAHWPSGRPRTVQTPFRATVSLTLADLDGDHHDEIVLVTADRARVARLTGASLTVLPEARGSEAPTRAPTPPRQPLGSSDRDDARHAVRVRSSRQASMAEMTLADGAALLRALGVDLYPAPGIGCVRVTPGGDTVSAFAARCDANASPAGERVAAVPVAMTTRAGRRWEAHTDGRGRCVVRRDGLALAPIDDVAAPLVLDDLDGDGTPELITASASAPDRPDRVRVFTLGDAVSPRGDTAVPGPIEAMAAGDLDGDGHRELVVSVHDLTRHTSTLWIIP